MLPLTCSLFANIIATLAASLYRLLAMWSLNKNLGF